MKAGWRTLPWITVLTAVLFVTVVASANIGSVDIGYLSVAAIITDGVANLVDLHPGLYSGKDSHRTIVLDIRLPRIAVGAVVGFALGSAGAVMQGFFRNPMADPSIIGVSSGAAVGAVAAIVLNLEFYIPLAAFAGALIAAFFVFYLATSDGRTPVATLLLAGVAVQTFLGAAVSFLLYMSGNSLRRAMYWLMGNLVAKTWADFTLSLPFVAAGFLALLYYSEDLNILLMGEESAHSLGVNVNYTKKMLLAISSVVTAAAVAVSGVIGFVGLIVPHIMRLLVGPDHRILVPTSALAGASFLVATDSLAKTVLGAAELPVGIVTAFVGVPFFLYLLRKREVHDL
ncbi:MAG: vitamin B12 ABC transporter permease BtuC [Halobacteria archaeon]